MYIQIEFQKKSKLDSKVRFILRMPISRLYLTYDKFSKENESFVHLQFLKSVLCTKIYYQLYFNLDFPLILSFSLPIIFINLFNHNGTTQTETRQFAK